MYAGIMPASTTTFISRIDTDRQLLAVVGTMYQEAVAEHGTDPHARGWREQLAVLITWHGREVVIESLVELVPGLTMRHAVTMADLAMRQPSDLVPAAGG